jgi:hypothetical protein
MARRITGPGDIVIINSELKRLDLLQATINDHAQQIANLTKHTLQIRDARAIPSTNNLTFTWTGSTLTLSWLAGYIQDNSLKNYPVAAGSLVVAASTLYWLAWNPIQQTMAFNTNLQTLVSGLQLPQALATVGASDVAAGNNLVICAVTTGTSGQSGTAGGGGSDPGGVGVSGTVYNEAY